MLTMLTIRIPAPSSTLVTSLLGFSGLVAIVVAVGMLAGFAWALLGAGVITVALCFIAQNVGRPVAQPITQPAAGKNLKAVS